MTLGELIAALREMPPEGVVTYGFSTPHSWRGDYSELAFEPCENARIGDMLAHAESALGRTFTGYKGGEFTMHDFTPCWIDEYGCYSYNGISQQLVNYWRKEVTS